MALLVAIKGLVPVGYMPDLAKLQKHEWQITICSSQAPRQITVGDDGQPVHKSSQHDASTSDVCPFGAAPQTALLNFIPAVAIGQILPLGIIAFAEEFLLKEAHSTTAQPRAPPLSA